MTTNTTTPAETDNEPTRRIEAKKKLPAATAAAAPKARDQEERKAIKVPFSKVRLAANVRKTIDQKKIDELAASIWEVGLIQPPTGRALADTPDEYELVIGQRRYFALQLLHAKDPARFPELELMVTTASDADLPLLQLAENLGRESMEPYDVVVELTKQAADGNHSAPELAEKVGLSASAVKAFLRIGRAPEYVRVLLLRVESSVRVLDGEGKPVVDRHGRAEMKMEVLAGLDVKKVTALTKLAEALVGNDKRCAKTPGYKPMAERVVLRLARRCVVEQWTVDTLEARCDQALKAPSDGDEGESAAATEPTTDANALVVKKSKVLIDSAKAGALRGPARVEFIANLRAALAQLNLTIQDATGH